MANNVSTEVCGVAEMTLPKFPKKIPLSFPSDFTKKQGYEVLVDWVTEAEEYRKEMVEELQKLKVTTDLEHAHPSMEFWKGWNKAIDKVLKSLK